MTKVNDLDNFTKAYIEAALFTGLDESDESGGAPLDDNYSIYDIHSDSLKIIKKQCEKFQKKNAKLLKKTGEDDGALGHCFWMSIDGQGTGFWDSSRHENWNGLGEALERACDGIEPNSLFVGDDGKLHVDDPEPKKKRKVANKSNCAL